MSSISMDAFDFRNPACSVVFDISHPYPGKEDVLMKVCRSAGDEIRFAFAAGKGLARLDNSTKIAQENVLGELLAVDERDPNTLISFFSENGYLLPIEARDGEYQSIPLETLCGIVSRIKATVLLMSELGTPKPDYLRIMALVVSLVMADTCAVKNADEETVYATCDHEFSKILKMASTIPPIDGEVDANTKGYYEISDTIYGAYHLDSAEYEDIADDYTFSNRYPGIDDMFYRDVVYLYRNATSTTVENRQMIDFLFHFMHQVAIPEKCHADGSIETYADPKMDAIDDQLMEGALRAARIVLDKEINTNLKGISPYYDIERLEPSWKTDSLLSALYLSVFLLRPGIEIFRRCGNPNCSCSFLVKTTSMKQKYCSSECSNAMAQRFYRKRKMAQKQQ